MDGLDVLERIKHERPDVAVLILSARRDVATKLAGLRGGACDYMIKPFSFDELVERIRIHKRAQAASQAGGEVLRGRRDRPRHARPLGRHRRAAACS